VTAVLLSLNWLVFVWAIQTGRVLQSSLGYFMNPLVNVVLGALFLHERLRPAQAVAVAVAAAGVAVLAVVAGEVPWIALALASSFGVYGLLRKTAKADALVGLTVESAIMAVPAVAFLVACAVAGRGAFLGGDLATDLLLVATGPVTAVPLLWFANAARRLRYATLGFFLYVTPTLHFVLAVAAYGESVTPGHWAAFTCIWVALAIYTADAVRRLGRVTPSEAAGPAARPASGGGGSGSPA
jgi:chloramphenicol-sensitive protein RarD